MRIASILIIIVASLSACTTAHKLADVPALPITRDSIVVRERIVTDTLIIPDTWVEYLDTTECPPSPEPVTIIQERKVTVPARTVYVDRIVTDTVTVRTNLTRENELLRIANERTALLNEANAKYKTLRRKHTNVLLIGGLLLLALCLLIPAKLRKNR